MKRKDAVPLIEKRISQTKWLTYEDIQIEEGLFKRLRTAARPSKLSMQQVGDHIIQMYRLHPVELVDVPEADDEIMGQIEMCMSICGSKPIPVYLVWLNGQGWVSSEEWFPLFQLVVKSEERN